MEIERKYLLDQLPENLTSYPCKKIEQAIFPPNRLSASAALTTNII